MRPLSALTPLEAHLREQVLSLAGLTPVHLARLRTRAAERGITGLRLYNAAGAWLELLTDAPLTSSEAVVLADVLTAAMNRPVNVVRLEDLQGAARGAAWALAVPL